ncbi:MAG: L-ribulose-5-phosphate 3-epimerase [Malacoplasma sp.]
MKFGIYEKAINNKFSWEEKILIAKNAGFDYIEISIDESDEKLSRLDWDEHQINGLLLLLKKHGMYFQSMCLSGHRKFPFGSLDSSTRARAYEIIDKAIKLAVKLNIRIIQLAGYDVYYEKSNAETVHNFIQGLKYASSVASLNSIMLAFEVMDTPFMGTIEKAKQYVDLINSPWLQIYPDIGNLSQFSEKPENEIVHNIGNIVAFHVKEAIKTKMRDIPFGEGNVNFVSIFKAILSTNYSGPFMIEMWSLNNENETIEQNVCELVKAKDFVVNEFKKAGYKNV